MLTFETAAGEDFDLGVGQTTKTAPGSGTLPSTQISLTTFSLVGPGGQAQTQAWTPGQILAGQSVSTTVNVQGCLPGDFCWATHDGMGANNLLLQAFVSSAGVVTVVMANPTAGPITIGAGTVGLRLLVFRVR